ncbi:acetoacetate--CoA ligase [Sphingomonas colocasiae]|uniref:Acetoacetate--CoA ligase n=1 Tax=Sphingomonas colocasiae TaxID=1848973 RepID=A0ABS7PSM3_9SPHN|nr:acetoacetate--CoA ligase [Sphingomonas colocasiae]MBY8824335.1 acetoacetate--CoA ligase [Sphingomonas colocasiae]
MIEEGALLWSPSPGFAANSNLTRYMQWLEARGRPFQSYDALWRWSVQHADDFWASLWGYFEIESDGNWDRVRSAEPMPATRWFEGARVNLAEHILRNEVRCDPGATAIQHLSEVRPLETLSWTELGDQVRRTATALRAMGIGPGDRVAACLPNIVEAAVALLASAAIGAVWTSVAPEFGVRAAIDRLGQVAPKLIFVTDGYRYMGSDHDCMAATEALLGAIGTIEHVVLVPNLDPCAMPAVDSRFVLWDDIQRTVAPARGAFRYARVDSGHPLWVLFTSGTTGMPKPIVHGQLGLTLELFRAQSLSTNIGPGSTLFNYASTAWVVWNMLVGSLITGSAIVLYDGHPLAQGPGTMWDIAEQTGTTDIGFSPNLVCRMMQAGIVPGETHDLSALQHAILVGSPASPDIYGWLNDAVKPDLWITSQAGSTEMCVGFAGGVPILPVRAGEIQARLLGMALDCWSSDGESLIDEAGELVMTAPCPMMPLALWGDAEGERYRESYFADFSGIWRQGDRCRITANGGLVILGRSDATLNRGGVRIGTAELYRTVCDMAEVEDAIAVEAMADGASQMILFVRPAEGCCADAAFRARINDRLRIENSPRHVPDQIVAVPAIPYTATGKRMEVPVRRLLEGADPAQVGDRNAMADPAAFDWFATFARDFRNAGLRARRAMVA